ncbi:MAG: transposase family protein [Actinomycetota bacterium]|nr:transposase family protein [Actinomycetota bacterium]
MCARVNTVSEAATESDKVTWPPILGLFTSVVVTLTYLRRNRIQDEIGESYGVSQSTVSRAVTALTPLLGTTLAPHVPVAEDLSSQAHYIVDGTLLPCWSWPRTRRCIRQAQDHGMNVQVACTLTGGLAWISDPIARQSP